jgi:hypothetical protein
MTPAMHVLTVHWQSPEWIEPQLRHLRRFVPEATVWASLDGIDHTWDARVDHALRLEANHAEKLNELARRASAEADADDVLVFLDGDAFPIAPIRPDVLLAGVALAAVRRDENLGDPQPHPCFCCVRVGTWEEIGGDWREGPSWINAAGQEVTDVGARVGEALRTAGQPWRALRRSNRRDLDPLFFAVYGGLVYHHGAGFRPEPTRLHLHRVQARRRSRRALVSRVPAGPARRVAARGTTLAARASDAVETRRARRADHLVRSWIDGDDDLLVRLVPPGRGLPGRPDLVVTT